MLKRLAAPYLAGRKKGDWWKWKVDPLTIDAVMIYAQAGSGRRATLYTDFTFAVWNGPPENGDLVPFTKAYSGLTDAEFAEITRWVRKNTTERFGPVRAVRPEHVFEIAFEGIQESTRHKSGVALRFPRMARWRRDKPLARGQHARRPQGDAGAIRLTHPVAESPSCQPIIAISSCHPGRTPRDGDDGPWRQTSSRDFSAPLLAQS
jgi:ATP-dependent DNA ligase